MKGLGAIILGLILGFTLVISVVSFIERKHKQPYSCCGSDVCLTQHHHER